MGGGGGGRGKGEFNDSRSSYAVMINLIAARDIASIVVIYILEDGCSCSLPSVASAATPQEVYQRDGASALGPVPINSGGMQSAEVMRRPAVNINLLQSRRLSQDR